MHLLPRRTAVVVFLAFAFAYFLSALVRAITATLSPTLTQEFSLTAGDLGLLAGGYFLGFAAMQLPLGRWLDRHGPKQVLLAFLALGVWIMSRIVNSLLGRSFMAVRNSDELAEALGIDLMRTKTLSFVLSVVYAGFAGALYAGQVRFLGPDLASEVVTFDLVMFVLVGGIGTLLGPLVGTGLVTWMTQGLQFLQDYRMVVFGPVLIALIIFLPDGIVGTWLNRRARRADTTRGKPHA